MIVLVLIGGWLNSIFIPFLNDDFQIIGWHNPASFVDIFKPFWTGDVSGFYWRPLVNSLHSLTLWVFGFNAYAFYSTNLLIYILCCIAFYYLLKRIGILPFPAFLTALFFGLAPSHEIVIGWIAGRGDALAGFFLILAMNSYLKFIQEENKTAFFFYLGFLILGFLSKEIAFAGVFIPILSKLIFPNQKSFKHFIISVIIGIAVFSIRFLFSSPNIFQSPNATEFSLLSSLLNLILYLPSTIVSATLVKNLDYFNVLTMIVICGFLGAQIYYWFKERKAYWKLSSMKLMFGLTWFVLFIIPVISIFMRWYVFVPSIGLFIILGTVLSSIDKEEIKKRIRFDFVILLTGLLLLNISQMSKWVETGKMTQKALQSISSIDLSGYKNVTLWGVPDKIDDINAMKVGVQQAVQLFSNNKAINVRSPLRFELESNSITAVEQNSETGFNLTVQNGKIFPIFSQSVLNNKNQTFYLKNIEYELKIRNGNPSKAYINYFFKYTSNINLVFIDGKFRKL